jgi:hypothetical protein
LPSASTLAMKTVSPWRLPYDGHLVPRQRSARVHQRTTRVGMGLRDQPLDRHVDEARVGEVAVAIVIRELLGLDHEVHRVGGEEGLLVQLERLQQVEHFENREALRRRRRLDQRDAAVAADERLAPARVLRLQVGGGEEAAFSGGEARQRGADLAA